MQATGYSVQCQASTRALKGKKDIEGGQLEVTIQLHMYNTVYRDDDAEKKKMKKRKKLYMILFSITSHGTPLEKWRHQTITNLLRASILKPSNSKKS